MNNPDFLLYMVLLEDERKKSLDGLMSTKCPVTVHQLQGETRLLTELIRAATSAPEDAALLAKRTQQP
jgi:hypothetical protein